MDNFISLEMLSYLVVFLPLTGALTVGFTVEKINHKIAQIITCLLVGVAATAAVMLFTQVGLEKQVVHVNLFNWISIGNFQANWAIYIDTLTSLMLMLVTIVSSLVHIYSIGYMSHDHHKPRFMAYLSLFTFFMIMLITADNFLQMFFGWEGVGLASYLLIGFWFEKPTANRAAMKAFIVNRVGDFGFALGIFAIFWYTGSIEFARVFEAIPSLADVTVPVFGCGEVSIITLSAILLFVGAMGKSAQLGLHVWLPDAMEGPTPVSALIHAATMVTAGVFMVARCSPIFEYSPVALEMVTCIGAFTCLFAATIALVQNDIKRVIAYSTCSQLGYMFMACGVSAYSAGIFHLLTHGFFKALLFLGAGSVIHAVSGEQDIRKMGGLYGKIPFTYAMMWIGSLALAGIFPFAGFYSKDSILEAAIASSPSDSFGPGAYALGLLAAVMTAFYSWRLIIKVFHGTSNVDEAAKAHIHESPISMTVPLLILAVGAIGAGYVGDKILHMVEPGSEFWNGSITVLPSNDSLANISSISHIYGYLPLIAGIFGIIAAYFSYSIYPSLSKVISARFNGSYRLLLNKYYFDEFYHHAIVAPTKNLGQFLWLKFDTVAIDGVPNAAASLTARSAKIVGLLQNGLINRYSFVMILGLAAILTWALFLMN